MNSQLGIRLEPQCKPQWCWAAVAATLGPLFGDRLVRSQCRVAEEVFGQSCCPSGTCDWADTTGDVPLNIVPVLGRVGVAVAEDSRRDERHVNALVWESVVVRRRPLVVLVAWLPGLS